MADAKRCETCTHWAGGEEYSEALGVVGACNATIETWSATDSDADYNQFLKPEYKDTTAFVADGSSYSATLYTRPLHFCSMWKGRATNGVQRGDGAERRVEAFIEKRHAEIRSCSRGCCEYGQCKANMHGFPGECPARGSSVNAGVIETSDEAQQARNGGSNG